MSGLGDAAPPPIATPPGEPNPAPPNSALKTFAGGWVSTSVAINRWFAKQWLRIPKPARYLLLVIFVIYVYLFPKHHPGFLDTKANFVALLGQNIIPYILVALGLNVVVGMAGLLDLGYVGFYATGAYCIAILTSQHASLPWLLALPISVVLSMLAGVLLGAPTLRLRGDYLAIVTLGFGEIIRLLALSTDWLGAASGIGNIKSPPNFGGPFKFSGTIKERNLAFYYLAVTLVIIVFFFIRRLEHSRVGRSWTAIREDEDAAELMGVPTFKFKLWAFAIGAGVGGLAGTLYASNVRFINPQNFELKLSILFLAAVILGGPGNQAGVILGAALIAYLPERLRFLNTSRYFYFGVVLMFMMLFRPQGIIPRRLRARKRERAPEIEEEPFRDVSEGDPDLEGGARGPEAFA